MLELLLGYDQLVKEDLFMEYHMEPHPLQLAWMLVQITITHPQTLLFLTKLLKAVRLDSVLGLIFHLGGDPHDLIGHQAR